MNSSNAHPLLKSLGLMLLFSSFSLNSNAFERAAYWHLAYKPSDETRVIDMPGTLFAVQLLAVTTKQQVEAFAEQHDLYDLTAVQIEQKGKKLYVLMPGVYKNREDAETAVASLPSAVRAMNPWIRPLAGLQQAMHRAQSITYAAADE